MNVWTAHGFIKICLKKRKRMIEYEILNNIYFKIWFIGVAYNVLLHPLLTVSLFSYFYGFGNLVELTGQHKDKKADKSKLRFIVPFYHVVTLVKLIFAISRGFSLEQTFNYLTKEKDV